MYFDKDDFQKARRLRPPHRKAPRSPCAAALHHTHTFVSHPLHQAARKTVLICAHAVASAARECVDRRITQNTTGTIGARDRCACVGRAPCEKIDDDRVAAQATKPCGHSNHGLPARQGHAPSGVGPTPRRREPRGGQVQRHLRADPRPAARPGVRLLHVETRRQAAPGGLPPRGEPLHRAVGPTVIPNPNIPGSRLMLDRSTGSFIVGIP